MSEPLYVLIQLHPRCLDADLRSGCPIRSYTSKDRAVEDMKLLSEVVPARAYTVVEVPHIDA